MASKAVRATDTRKPRSSSCSARRSRERGLASAMRTSGSSIESAGEPIGVISAARVCNSDIVNPPLALGASDSKNTAVHRSDREGRAPAHAGDPDGERGAAEDADGVHVVARGEEREQ